MAGLYSSRNAMAVRPRFAVEEMGPPQPYPSTQEVVQNFGQGVYRGAMFTPELLAEAALMARYPEPSDMAPEDFAAYMAMLEQQQQDAEMPAEGLFGQMVAPDVTDLLPGIGGALGAMYVPLRNVDLAKLTRAASGEVVDDIPRAFSALHDRMPRVEVDDSAATVTRSFPDLQIPFKPNQQYALDEVLQHPTLSDTYGGDLQIPVNLNPDLRQAGYYSDGGGLSQPGISIKAQYVEGAPVPGTKGWKTYPGIYQIGDEEAGTLFHELQHAVQERGGFARGGSPDAMELEYNNARARLNFLQKEPDYIEANQAHDKLWDAVFDDDMPMESAIAAEQALYQQYPSFGEAKQVMDKLRLYGNKSNYDAQDTFSIGRDAYRRLAGEIEARDTAARMSMNAMERSRTQPYTGYQVRPDGSFGPAYDIGGNIPLEDYIVRMR